MPAMKKPFRLLIASLVVCLAERAMAVAESPADQAADMLLLNARRAYDEKNYGAAAQRYKEFLDKFSSNKSAPAARYGLAVALLEGPERDFARVVEQLKILADNKAFAEYPYVVYDLGIAHRGLGVRSLSQMAARPNEASKFKEQANQSFEEARKSFTAAAAAFVSRSTPNDTARSFRRAATKPKCFCV